ncbi:MAG: selenocysteine-specific translation elongation factor [bacterium]
MSASDSRHFILGAAGHVDHGKTALITALTGVNTDRLKEEQERGISIELGFAELPVGDDIVLGVVDMPGHERFVKQMVAGSGGVDLAFLVIAADEGVMPQTVEHLDILDSLDVASGVVVLTKTDLVDEEIAAVAAEEALDLVAGTFLEDKPLVMVSAVTGDGLEELLAKLYEEASALPTRRQTGPFRLPMDRVFSLPGIGVIVTGTCWSGSVAVGDRLLVEPGGLKVRVREVQAHGAAVPRGGSGQRLALALHGVKKDDLERGFQVVTPESCLTTRRLDLRVNVAQAYKGVIKNRQRLHVHHAGREVLGRIVLLDEPELGGDVAPRTGFAQLHLEQPLVGRRGDRLVLRFYSPVTTIAGGVILDTDPGRHKRFDESVLQSLAILESGDPAELFRQKLREAGLEGLAASEAKGVDPDPVDDPGNVRAGDRLYDREILTTRAGEIGELLQKYRAKHPLRLGVPKEEARRRVGFSGGGNAWNDLCQVLAELGGWRVAGDKIVPLESDLTLPGPLQTAVEQRAASLQKIGLAWPGLAAFREQHPVPAGHDHREEDFLRHLVDRGIGVAIAADYYVHAEAFARVVAVVRRYFAKDSELTFGQFRELTGQTRKLGIPMLEYLDANGYTRRVGDKRQPGPALNETA